MKIVSILYLNVLLLCAYPANAQFQDVTNTQFGFPIYNGGTLFVAMGLASLILIKMVSTILQLPMEAQFRTFFKTSMVSFPKSDFGNHQRGSETVHHVALGRL